MNVLKLNKANKQNSDMNEDFVLKEDVLDKDALKQIKGGTTDGDEEDDNKLIDPV